MPSNKTQAPNRLSSPKLSLEKKPVTKEHFYTFMEKTFRNAHTEEAPPLKENEE